MIELNKIYCENCLETMSRMDPGSIDLTVTSPPYDNLRDYKGYSFDFEAVAKSLYNVTKVGGVVVWVVGDATLNGSETGTSFKQALFFIECGFRLHDTMIYKKNGASYPSNENSLRYSQVFEYMYVFSKNAPQTTNLLKDKKNRWAGHNTFGKTSYRKSNGILVGKGNKRSVQDYGYRDNIWTYDNGSGYGSEDEITFQHPATFPEKLAADHIYTWSNEGDIVYDPFSGSGTTAKMAHLQKRNWIGSEISKEYCDLAEKRLKPHLQKLTIF